MKRKIISQHLINLLFLPLCAIFVVLSFLHPYESQVQLWLGVTTLLAYFGLSWLRHSMDKSLTLRVIFEYILVGTLAFIVILGVLG